MLIQPYLFFEGRCEEALEFYKKAIGAEVEMLMRNRESPDEPPPGVLPPGSGDKVLHACVRVGEATFMASDGGCSGSPNFQGVSLSLTAPDVPTAKRLFEALSAGGQTQMPFGETFFSPGFGMVADKFGVSWMVYVAKDEQQG